MSSFRLDNEGLRNVLSGQDGAVWLSVLRTAKRVENSAKRKAPVDQGKLRASITTEMRSENNTPVAVVGSNLEYAIYVHEGTGLWSKRKPGPIRPVRAKVLRWPRKNQSGSGRRRYRGGRTDAYVYAKQSAGSPPKPFLTDALREVTGQA